MNAINEKEVIARRVAQELKDGYVVNLGIGLPTLVASYLPKDKQVTFQSENGLLGMGGVVPEEEADYNITNAGAQYVSINTGASFFDSAMSFAVIRGGHVDVTVLGALQVDEKGNIASHMIPGKLVPGMGGAMDLLAGSKKVIVAMVHTAKGEPKILKECALPLTAVGRVNMIVTEKCVLEVTPEGLLLTEVLDGSSVEDIINSTEAHLIIDEKVISK